MKDKMNLVYTFVKPQNKIAKGNLWGSSLSEPVREIKGLELPMPCPGKFLLTPKRALPKHGVLEWAIKLSIIINGHYIQTL